MGDSNTGEYCLLFCFVEISASDDLLSKVPFHECLNFVFTISPG